MAPDRNIWINANALKSFAIFECDDSTPLPELDDFLAQAERDYDSRFPHTQLPKTHSASQRSHLRLVYSRD